MEIVSVALGAMMFLGVFVVIPLLLSRHTKQHYQKLKNDPQYIQKRTEWLATATERRLERERKSYERWRPVENAFSGCITEIFKLIAFAAILFVVGYVLLGIIGILKFGHDQLN